MSRVICAICVAAVLAALSGCVEMKRTNKALAPEIIGDSIKVRKPGIAASMPRTEGLADVKFASIEGFYRVAKTDTLVSITEKFYGDTRYMRQLVERNKDIINAGGGVKRGMVLVIPRLETRPGASPPDIDATAAEVEPAPVAAGAVPPQ